MFNQLLTFAARPEMSDLMMRPGMEIKAKTPAGWVDVDGSILGPADEAVLVNFAGQVTGRSDWLEVIKKTKHADEFVIDLQEEDVHVRLRCKAALCNSGTSYTVNMRKIPSQIMPLEKTGLPQTVSQMVNQGKGLIIVTGPTHAGKTTTLAAMVDMINRFKQQHIVTLERPIEYIHTNNKSIITQRDVPADVPTFQEGLHDALRQSISTIMIGEITDRQTVDTMLMAAETGHLVLGTMHTPSAKDTIMRLASFYGPDEAKQKMAVLSSVLNGIVGQVLLPNAAGTGWELGYELLVNSPQIASAIYGGDVKAVNAALEMASKNQGDDTCLMNDVLARLVKERRVSKVSAMYASYNQTDLMNRPELKI